jgi:hypothetical protein
MFASLMLHVEFLKEQSPDLCFREDDGGNPAAGVIPAAGGHGRQRVSGQKAEE